MMENTYLQPLFPTGPVSDASFVVFVNRHGSHDPVLAPHGTSKAAQVRISRLPADLGAYAINVKPKVKP